MWPYTITNHKRFFLILFDIITVNIKIYYNTWVISTAN